MRRNILAILLFACLFSACSSSDDDEVASRTDNFETVDNIDSDYTYELPVIFHVLYKDESDLNQYIPYQRLASILEYVNNIYQGGIYGESENVHVKFVLATKDENGRTLNHPGVEYVRYSGEYPIDPYSFMSDETGANVKYIWDPNNYINVMMYNFKQTSDDEVTLGVSHMPYTVKGNHEVEGLNEITQSHLTKRNLKYAYCSSINSLYAYRSSDGGYYQSSRYTNPKSMVTTYYSADIVVTLAHELGHYLGLYHVFTESNKASDNDDVQPADSCADTDYCTDTKSYNRHEYIDYEKYLYAQATQPSLNQLLIRYACDGSQYNSSNIMDYSWTLGYQITKEQKQRIRNVLYYSPLIPGPKMAASAASPSSRAAENEEPMNLKITIIR